MVVNGYGKHQDEADNFAAWLCTDSADKLFDRSTLVPAKKSAAQQTEEMAAFWQEYSQTVPVPKLMATANFWVQMEIAETKIWEGENVSDVLKDLSEKIMTQVTGTQYVEEEYIEVPTETQIDYAESEEVVEESRRELTKADVQRESIIKALRRHNGRRKDAAAELFMSERTLYRKIKELGIDERL